MSARAEPDYDAERIGNAIGSAVLTAIALRWLDSSPTERLGLADALNAIDRAEHRAAVAHALANAVARAHFPPDDDPLADTRY